MQAPQADCRGDESNDKQLTDRIPSCLHQPGQESHQPARQNPAEQNDRGAVPYHHLGKVLIGLWQCNS